jgi:site-specific recombinase XerD
MNPTFYLSKFIRSFFQDYLICQRNMSSDTVQSYRDATKLFIIFAADQAKKSPTKLLVTDITQDGITDFLRHLENNRKNSIQTRNHRLVVLRRIFEYISLREPFLIDHCRKILSVPLKRNSTYPEICYLEKQELAALFDVIDTRTVIGRRDYALLLFMYNTGARVTEASSSVVAWLSLQPPYKVEILGKGRKWRTCPLWKSTVTALRTVLSERRNAIKPEVHLFTNRFGKPLSRFGIRNVIEKYKNKAVLQMPSLRTKTITPHTLRHTTAMHLLQSGVEINVIRSWLGHVKLETTHRYAEIDLAMKTKALEACELTDRSISSGRWRSDPDILKWLESL